MARGIGNTRCVRIKTSRPVSVLPDMLQDKVKQHHDDQIVLQLNRDSDSIVEILDALKDAGVEVADIETRAADLEDVFIELTSGNRV